MSRPISILPLFALLANLAFAQSGKLDLDVKDQSGAATTSIGTIERLSAGVITKFETDDKGHYEFTGLIPGRYRVEVKAPGFAPQSALVEVTGEATSLPITLAVSADTTRVEVVSGTPLPGSDLLASQVPAAVQRITADDIVKSGAVGLFDTLNQRMNNVFVNEVNGNPFQPDVNYRGFTSSPLLGTPQGISVYMDGVRMNQPFGDVVSWDLIPRIAIAETALIPGSDPLFGLNTLGGAISIRTKDGTSYPGTRLQIAGGSWGRRMIDLEHGGAKGRFDYYGATSLFFEDGWRDTQQSNVRQFMGKAGWHGDKTTFGVSATYANNHMNGGGLQEMTLLNRNYNSNYTKPDISGNRSPLINVTGRHVFNNNLTFFGNAYYRYVSTRSFNADINEDSLDQSLYQPSAAERNALAGLGYTNIPTSGLTAANTPFPFLRCLGQSLLNDEPGEKCNGLINRTTSQQHDAGFSGQMTWLTSPRSNKNQFTAGGAWDRNSTHFISNSQLGYLNPDRTVTPVPSFADGVHAGDVDGEPLDTRVNLKGVVHTGSLYFTNTLTLGHKWDLTVSGRYNHTTIDNRDGIRPAGGSGSLNGNYTFDRFNPAVGATFHPASWFETYARYSESNRAPTSIELGCADPDVPCKLPNAMAGDPPLNQVVARTVEAGYRGQFEGKARWSAGYFRTQTRNDIMFVAAPQTGFGYFKNFGKTLRQGMELDFNTSAIKRVNLGVNYTYLAATFQSPESVNGSGNSTNEDALAGRKGLESSIDIAPGNQIPLTPRHMAKAYADIQVTKKFSLNLNATAFGSSFARGNENNLHKADGLVYLGPGKSGGYALMNLGGRYQLMKRLEIFGRITNLADRKYTTGAQLGPMGFDPNTGNFSARPLAAVNGDFPVRQSTFYAPGAPRTIWGGVRISF